MKVGDLVRTTRNTQKHFGIGIVITKHLYEIGNSTFLGDNFLQIYWIGLRKKGGMFEEDHHLVLVSEKNESKI